MSPFTRICQAVLILVLTAEAQAKSATEIFESASGSVVVVYGNDVKGQHKSLGSGVVLPDGAVVTNCHVIEKSDRFVVKHRQQEYPAILKHADHDRDVCSLSVEGLKAPAAYLGTTKTLKVGQRVYAIGAPQGLELTLSEGIVSSLREVEGGQYIQTSAPISPGSSGGGLFDIEGRLIGLPTFYLADGQQLNFAVPVEWVQDLPQRNAATQKPETTTLTDWLGRAIELNDKKDWPALIRHAKKWIKNSPRESLAWDLLGTAYVGTGQTIKAIDAYQQALRILPKLYFSWFSLGAIYSQTGQTAKAIDAYQQVLRIDPESAAAWFGLGQIYGQTGQTAKGIEAYQQALRINPTDDDAWYYLGNTYREAGQPTKAIEVLHQALRINPKYARAWANLGFIYDQTGQPAKGIEAYQQALRINPEYADAWYFLGNTYGEDGQTANAIEAYQQALRINPKNASAWYNLGVAYEDDGQQNRVMDVYRELKGLSPQKAEEFFTKFVLP